MSTIEEIRTAAENELEFKFCHACCSDKPLTEWHRNGARKDGLATQCKSCVKINSARHYRANAEAIKASTAQYHRDNPEFVLAVNRRWNSLNKDKRNYYTRLRQASKLNATPPWLTEAQKQEIAHLYWLSRDAYLTTGEKYEVDHIIPLRGKDICGLHVPWNLQVLPADLNRKKSNNVGRPKRAD